MRKQPFDRAPSENETTREELARSVRRALEAKFPLAVVELLGPGRQFTPSRGGPGAWYVPHEISVRELSPEGSGGFVAGIALYPPPGSAVKRVIVLPLERGNWLAHDARLERTVLELIDEQS